MNSVTLPLTEPAFVFGVLFVVILFAPILMERARIPGIIGLILAGVLIGPNGLGVLEREGAIALLGGVGLLYLMFLGGVEMDLDGFADHRRDSIVFGAITFCVPMMVLAGAASALDFDVLAALLLASAFTSHTLLAYPIVQRFGLLRHRAVTATLGATVLATVAALMVLAAVAAMHQGAVGTAFWITLVASLLAFGGLTMWGLPLVTRWVFAGLGQDRNVRFVFVLVALFAASALADFAGIEAIVGAFLAGLALNRFVVEGGQLAERLRFFGSALLVPLFLIATGMLIDPLGFFGDPRGLLVGGVLAVAAVGSKWLAAALASALLGFGRPETGVMFALSSGQAAGALAAALVAVNIGLIGQETLNAVVFVILVSALLAPIAAIRYAPKMPPPPPRSTTLGQRIVVPIANPRSASSLVKIAALVAGPDRGEVVPVNVLTHDATPEQLAEHREITAEAERVALRNGAEAESRVRIDSSPTEGVLHTIVEGEGTCVLLGWKGYANRRENFFGDVIDAILAKLTVPALVCRPGEDTEVRRIVVSVKLEDLSPGGRLGLDLAAEVGRRMARQTDVPLLVVTERESERITELFEALNQVKVVADPDKPPAALRRHTEQGDVVILSSPPTRAGLGQNASRVARAIAARTVVVAVARLDGGR